MACLNGKNHCLFTYMGVSALCSFEGKTLKLLYLLNLM